VIATHPIQPEPGTMGSVDYSLYLVTDSTPAILGERDLVEVVDAALSGGVTVVQYRDKVSDTGVLVSTARKLHAVTRKHNVPLLINDRVDVALAVGCEGVHIGQDDLGLYLLACHAFSSSTDLKQICPVQGESSATRPLLA
jgi:thiamine monophosphate synthase